MNEADVYASLKHLPVSSVRYYESISSTNDAASDWVGEGAENFSLVLANEQTAGRGRRARRWFTPKDSALAFTLILRPETANFSSVYTVLGALAVCRAIDEILSIEAQIKWPNDVLINGLKAAGVLAEAIWEGDRLIAVLIGIGVNVTGESIPKGEHLAYPAGYLEAFSQDHVDRVNLLSSIVGHAVGLMAVITSPEIVKMWDKHLALKGEIVTIFDVDGKVTHTGQVIGINHQGELMLDTESEGVICLSGGEVSLRRSPVDSGC